MLRDKIKNIVTDSIETFVRVHSHSIKVADIRFDVGVSAGNWWGDYYTNIAFILGKSVKENPMNVGEKLKEIIREEDQAGERLFSKIEVVEPGYINFWIEPLQYREILRTISKQKSPFLKKRETVVIDYSGPNVAKPMGVGHLRSTILGQALVNLYRFLGYKVVGDNHLGDWGTQFGALLYMYKRRAKQQNNKEIKEQKNIIEYLFELYTEFFREAEGNSELWEKAKEEIKKLQEGDKENKKLWQWFVKESKKEFDKIYNILGVKFDVELGESFYREMLQEVVKDARQKGVARVDEGAVKIFFDPLTPRQGSGQASSRPEGEARPEGAAGQGLQPIVVQKADGSYLYTTTDLAGITYRVKKWNPAKILYVVSNEQTLHFQQVFEAAAQLGYIEKEKLVHVKFGLVLGEKGTKMSTRRGDIIRLEELLEKAISLAREVVEKTNPMLSVKEKEKVANIVGVGAVKWNDLSQHRQKDIVFDWDRMLALKGESAPYVQYTYARLRSILRKAKGKRQKITAKALDVLSENEEQLILRHLLHYFEVIEDAANMYEPHQLAEYLYKLADLTNNFYEKLPVLKAEKETRSARLALIAVVSTALQQGLEFLGIDSPDKM